MLLEIADLVQSTDKLLERAKAAAQRPRALRSGDRVWTPLISSVEFVQGTAASANMVFNVPADTDFWAYRFTLYPYCKVIDPVNGTPDDVVYRPTSFTGQPANPGMPALSTDFSDIENQVDAVFGFISGGKEMQNVNIPAAAAYSTTMGKWVQATLVNVQQWGAVHSTPGGMVFDIPWFFPRGRAITCRVTPTYLGIRTITEEVLIDAVPTDIVRQHKYKLIGVLEGEKRVGAFR
jgi:hypothetical protein